MQHEPDPEQKEKSVSLGNTALIYSRALFTIVDGNSDYDKGLMMGRGETDQITADIDAHVKLFFHPAGLPQNLAQWESRAWTFQEKVLSRRMLVFSHGKALMRSAYSNGLPLKYLDTALLWQPQYKIRRRSAALTCPPSWSWAGWQLDETSSKERERSAGQTEGPTVFYRSTFDVFSDEQGIKLHLSRDTDKDGEERLRPFATFYILDPTSSTDKSKLKRVGLLNAPWLNHECFPMYPDWEGRMHMSDEYITSTTFKFKTPQNKKYLVVCTEEARFFVGVELFKGRRYTADSNAACVDIDFDVNRVGDDDARERLLFKTPTSTERVGIATCLASASRFNTRRTQVTAIVLSEAQFLGDESRPDVLGYPLYNVMLIKYAGGIAERIGLGKILKSAWRRANPKRKPVILG
jgi:hypothetical protein